MLYEFLITHHAELVGRCRTKVASRSSPKATPAELEHGVPMFLDQLVKTLRTEQSDTKGAGRPSLRLVDKASEQPAETEIGATATQHGMELLKQGFTIDQVVHDYGDLCQAVTELAGETGAPITVDEFRTLNRCLDDAIASAVTEFSSGHVSAAAGVNLQVSNERARALLHEMKTHVHTAELAITAIKAGNVGLKGATGAILDLSLVAMRGLIERSLPQAKPTVGVLARH